MKIPVSEEKPLKDKVKSWRDADSEPAPKKVASKSEEVKPVEVVKASKEEPEAEVVVKKPKRKCKPKVIKTEEEEAPPARKEIEKVVAPVKADSITIPVNGAKHDLEKIIESVKNDKVSSSIPIAKPILVKPSGDGGARSKEEEPNKKKCKPTQPKLEKEKAPVPKPPCKTKDCAKKDDGFRVLGNG